jgi:hypothetical protein
MQANREKNGRRYRGEPPQRGGTPPPPQGEGAGGGGKGAGGKHGQECRPAQRTPARGRTGRSEERARTDRPQGEGERARAAGREGGSPYQPQRGETSPDQRQARGKTPIILNGGWLPPHRLQPRYICKHQIYIRKQPRYICIRCAPDPPTERPRSPERTRPSGGGMPTRPANPRPRTDRPQRGTSEDGQAAGRGRAGEGGRARGRGAGERGGGGGGRGGGSAATDPQQPAPTTRQHAPRFDEPKPTTRPQVSVFREAGEKKNHTTKSR